MIEEYDGGFCVKVPGSTFTICVNMRVQEFTEKGAFFRVRLRSEQIRDKGIFLADLGNKGTLFMSLFIIWSNFVIFLAKCSCCHGH